LSDEEIKELRSTHLVRSKSETSVNEKPVSMEDFEFLMVIGRGSFGKVFLAEFKHTK